MCDIVGADFDKVNFKDEHWFWENEWTLGQQKQYEKWLVGYLKNDVKARNELMERPSKAKKNLEQFATYFVFNYGWKYKEDLSKTKGNLNEE